MNAFLSTILIVRDAGLKYQLNYEILDLDLALISRYVDGLLWVVTILLLIGTSLALILLSLGRSRQALLTYSIALALGLILACNGQTQNAGCLALVADLACLAVLCSRPKFLTLVQLEARTAITLVLAPVLFILLAIETASASVWICNIFDPRPVFDGSTRWNLPLLELKLADILYSFSPTLFLLAALSWLPTLPAAIANMGSATTRPSSTRTRLSGMLGLVTGLVFSLLVTQYPYVLGQGLQGVDATWYYSRLSQTHTISDATSLLFFEPRAPYLILLFLLRSATGLPALVIVEWGSTMLAASLAVSMLFFVLVVTDDWTVAGIGACLAVLSFEVTVGMYAGIYANWLAISPMLIGLGCLISYTHTRKPRYLAGFVLASYVVLIVHGWTWGIMIASVAASLIVTLIGLLVRGGSKLRAELKTSSVALLLTAAPVAAVILGATAFPIGPGFSAASSGYYGVVKTMSIYNLANQQTVLPLTLSLHVGGLLDFPPLFLLATLGVLSFCWIPRRGNRLLFAWLAATSVGSLLVDPWYQWRIIYLMPLPVFTVLGVTFVAAQLARPRSSARRLEKIVLVAFLFVVALGFLNYSFRSVSFLPSP